MRLRRELSLLAGTAATALLLTACGSDETTTPPPAAPATSEAAPSASATSAVPTPPTSASVSPSGSASTGTTLVDDRAELEVEDQRGNGRSVSVEEVRLSSGTGFVAIYRPDGQLLGSAEVTGGGKASTLTVELDDPIPATGDDYRAVLFGDDGDGSFDAETDPRVVEGDDDNDDDRDAVEDEFDYTLT